MEMIESYGGTAKEGERRGREGGEMGWRVEGRRGFSLFGAEFLGGAISSSFPWAW